VATFIWPRMYGSSERYNVRTNTCPSRPQGSVPPQVGSWKMSEFLWDGTRGLSGGKRSSLSSRDFRLDLVSGATRAIKDPEREVHGRLLQGRGGNHETTKMSAYHQIVLASRPKGTPTSSNFRLEEGPIPVVREGTGIGADVVSFARIRTCEAQMNVATPIRKKSEQLWTARWSRRSCSRHTRSIVLVTWSWQ